MFSKLPKILICHPGRQHSHQAAVALGKVEMLAGYWTGFPCLEAQKKYMPSFLWNRFKYYCIPLNRSEVRWNPISPVLTRFAATCFSSEMAQTFHYWGNDLFDRWVSRKIRSQSVDAVVAYETSALETFKEAKRKGIKTILDAASIHYKEQNLLLHSIKKSDGPEVMRKKEEEIKLADYILTVSDFARSTYLKHGVPSNKVFSVPLGVDLNLFKPLNHRALENKPFVFLLVGGINLLKGIDILLEATKCLLKNGMDFDMRLIGTLGDAVSLIQKAKIDNLHLVGKLMLNELVQEYQRADCFILPSRFDSFGLVVAEALACGTPVIVSDKVGAKDLIREAENGWIFPMGDVPSLTAKMFWCLKNRKSLFGMRQKARESAEKASWEKYHEKLIHFFRSIL